jgi:protein-tyrosine phosphatase
MSNINNLMTNNPQTDPRFLRLEGASNLRDLGGLIGSGGRPVRPGRIFRSDYIHLLSAADEAELVGRLGIRTVVDLRSEVEVAETPGAWVDQGIELLHTPLRIDLDLLHDEEDGLTRFYMGFLDPPDASMREAVAALLDAGRHPLLIHCSAGKDRTGMTVALMLELLGVDREAIVADYTLTQERMPAVLAKLAAATGSDPSKGSIPAAAFEARAETMVDFLAAFDRRYADVGAWLREYGFEDAAIDGFRAEMLG